MLDSILALIEAGVNVAPLLEKLLAIVKENRQPTDAELAELQALEADLDGQLAAAQPGDA